MISIAPYRVVVLKGGKTIPLWNGNGSNGLTIWVYEALSGMLGRVHEHGGLRRSRISRIAANSDGSVVSGIIQTGMNGFTSDLVHTETGQLSHHREVVEAEFIPFFFLLACPRGSDFGVLLLQRFGNLGARDFFVDPLVELYERSNASLRLRINRLVPADLARQVLQDGVIKSIRLVRYKDVEESSVSLGEGYAEHTKCIELVYKASRKGVLPKTENFFAALRGQKTLSSIFSVENFEYDTVKIDAKVNGRRRLIDLGRPTIMTPNVDVTDDIELDISGHPAWRQLIDVFGKFAQESLGEDGVECSLDLSMVFDTEATPLAQAA